MITARSGNILTIKCGVCGFNFEHTIQPDTKLIKNELEYSLDEWMNYTLNPCTECGTREVLNMNLPVSEEGYPEDKARPFVVDLIKEFKENTSI